MPTISLKISDQDKLFLNNMAKFEGVTLSELIRSKTFKALEDDYDARIADLALDEYNNSQEQSKPITALWNELNLWYIT